MAAHGNVPLHTPLGLLAELTHRCPLGCPYCSNPLELEARSDELDTATWKKVFSEAAALGVLHAHLSGGEPAARRDLVEIVAHCAAIGLYTNLITSGIGLTEDRVKALATAGLDHAQLSIQDSEAKSADRIAGYQGAFARKQSVAAWITAAGLPLTVNAVIHRANASRAGKMVELAVALGARRVEIAHTQYYGWGLVNRAALMPSREQLDAATAVVEEARVRLRGQLVIDYVTPDYYARRPKACMGGWAQKFLNISPRGDVLPCHAAETIPGMQFDNVRDRPLLDIWQHGEAFERYRGTAWMPEPCQSCPKKEVDWGGCRCQALALSGTADTLDPICEKSPDHERVRALAEMESANTMPPPYVYRRPARLAVTSE